jgi:hypothetical protein
VAIAAVDSEGGRAELIGIDNDNFREGLMAGSIFGAGTCVCATREDESLAVEAECVAVGEGQGFYEAIDLYGETATLDSGASGHCPTDAGDAVAGAAVVVEGE